METPVTHLPLRLLLVLALGSPGLSVECGAQQALANAASVSVPAPSPAPVTSPVPVTFPAPATDGLPPAPSPAAAGPRSSSAGDHFRSAPDRPVEPYPTNYYVAPFSRIGVGGDVNPLGIGLKGAIVLNTFMDGRLMGNFFNYSTGRLEVDGFNVNARLHLLSAAAALDFYPWHSIWRLSLGTLFLNQNEVTATLATAPGTSFSLNGQTYYSGSRNPATGATPLTGNFRLGLNRNQPALTLSGGFGKYIARLDRHWSFPSEFGVAITGPPTLQVSMAGWACLDQLQTQCSNVGNTSNPVGSAFNADLQSRLAKIRHNLNAVHIYPLFSYGVVYRFDTPW